MTDIESNRYFNPHNYVNYGFALLNKHVLGLLETACAPSPDLPLRYPPVFILGAPRSGSTLMMQVITDSLDLGYISNRHCQWFGYPALAERLFRPTAQKPQSDYYSRHGVTRGPYAPAECGNWWYRFFRRKPSYVSLQEVDPRKMRRFRQSIASLTNALDRPVLFKNLYASLRIQAIAHYIPESLFIVTHRDEVDNGHSILAARYRCFKDYEHWWSVEPQDVNRLKKQPSHRQVIDQIRHIHSAIDRDLRDGGVIGSRRLDVQYEEFCADPNAQNEAICEFLAENGCFMKRSGHVPRAFTIKKEIRIDQSLYDQMVSYSQCMEQRS